MTFMFESKVANEVGVNAAIILQNISFWCSKNRANGRNYHEGLYWTYNTDEAWAKLFSFLTKDQVRYALKKLVDAGLIKKGCFNKNTRDRTSWYAITPLGMKLIYTPDNLDQEAMKDEPEVKNDFVDNFDENADKAQKYPSRDFPKCILENEENTPEHPLGNSPFPSRDFPKCNNTDINTDNIFENLSYQSIPREKDASTPHEGSMDEMDELKLEELTVNQIKFNIDYENLVAETEHAEMVDELVSLMADTIVSKTDTFTVNRRKVESERVKSRLLKLKRYHIEYVIDCLLSQQGKIVNVRNYALTSLFNALDSKTIKTSTGTVCVPSRPSRSVRDTFTSFEQRDDDLDALVLQRWREKNIEPSEEGGSL